MTEAGIEIVLGTHGKHPSVSSNNKILIGDDGGGSVRSASLNRAVKKRCGGGFNIIVNGHDEPGQLFAVKAGHQVVHVESGENPARQVGAVRGHSIMLLAPGVDRQIHNEACLCIGLFIYSQPKHAGNCRHSGVARLFHG